MIANAIAVFGFSTIACTYAGPMLFVVIFCMNTNDEEEVYMRWE